MLVTELLVAAALSVPLGGVPDNHAQPGQTHSYPVVQRFERRAVDDYRRCNWNTYTKQLDKLWVAYRRAGSTPKAWESYQKSLKMSQYGYLYCDPYLLPFIR